MDLIREHLKVSVLLARYSVLTPAWRGNRLVNPFGRIYYIESGAGWLHHHDTRYNLRAGRLFMVPAHTEVSFGCRRQVVIQWAHFTATMFAGLDLFAYLKCPYEVVPDPPHLVRGALARLALIYPPDSPGHTLECDGILRQLLSLFVSAADPRDLTAVRQGVMRFEKVLNHIDSHLDRTIRVRDLARIAHLETAHFSRTFSRCFGLSPSRYVLGRRIELAQRMLVSTGLTLAAIADRSGFADPFHFSKTFKRVTGVCPSVFRKRGEQVVP